MSDLIDSSKTITRFFPGKRALDLMLTVSLLPFLLPVIGLTALATWVLHGRPLLFAQERPGLLGQGR